MDLRTESSGDSPRRVCLGRPLPEAHGRAADVLRLVRSLPGTQELLVPQVLHQGGGAEHQAQLGEEPIETCRPFGIKEQILLNMDQSHGLMIFSINME